MHFLSHRRPSFAPALFAVIVIFLGAGPRLLAQGGEPQYFAIRGATIVPVSGPRIENATVIISRGVITAVGKDASVPGEAWVIDGKGLTVYPGLVDSFTDVGLLPAAPPAGGEGGPRAPQVSRRSYLRRREAFFLVRPRFLIWPVSVTVRWL
jgi:hypothetical protein